MNPVSKLPPKRAIKPAVPMKALAWSKIPNNQIEGTIWFENMNEEESIKFDAKELEQVFVNKQKLAAGKDGALARIDLRRLLG